jgi:hypothetical protein
MLVFMFMAGMLAGGAGVKYWPTIKAKLLAWYDALVAKI